MENNNPNMPPPPPQWNQPYQQAPGGYQPYQGQGGYQPYQQGGIGMQTDLPGANSAQTCGIVGLILFFNIIGIALNIIAIVRGGQAMREYNLYPGRYTERSFRRAKTGKTCGIIGLCMIPFAIIVVAGLVAAFD